jgi:hypothetical protein
MKYSISKTDDLRDRLWNGLNYQLRIGLGIRLRNQLKNLSWVRFGRLLRFLLMNKLKRYEV